MGSSNIRNDGRLVVDQGGIAGPGFRSAGSSHLHRERDLLPCLSSKSDFRYPAIRHHHLLFTRSDLGPALGNFCQVGVRERHESSEVAIFQVTIADGNYSLLFQTVSFGKRLNLFIAPHRYFKQISLRLPLPLITMLTGIAQTGCVRRYVTAARGLIATWPGYDKTDRASHLVKAAHAELTRFEVPNPAIGWENMTDDGQFDFSTWHVKLSTQSGVKLSRTQRHHSKSLLRSKLRS